MMLRVVQKGFGKAMGRRMFSDAVAPATVMTLNFVTPHASVYKGKQIDKLTLPGEMGEYGITVGHSPIISQLRPGVVSVQHIGGEKEDFFVSGGFAITNDQSITDVTVSEAFPLSDIDENAVKTGYSEAMRALSSAEAGSLAHATAQTEANTNQAMARALGITL